MHNSSITLYWLPKLIISLWHSDSVYRWYEQTGLCLLGVTRCAVPIFPLRGTPLITKLPGKPVGVDHFQTIPRYQFKFVLSVIIHGARHRRRIWAQTKQAKTSHNQKRRVKRKRVTGISFKQFCYILRLAHFVWFRLIDMWCWIYFWQ